MAANVYGSLESLCPDFISRVAKLVYREIYSREMSFPASYIFHRLAYCSKEQREAQAKAMSRFQHWNELPENSGSIYAYSYSVLRDLLPACNSRVYELFLAYKDLFDPPL